MLMFINRRFIGGAIFSSIWILGWFVLRYAITTEGEDLDFEFSAKATETQNIFAGNTSYAYAVLCTNMRTVYPALVLFGQLKEVGLHVHNYVVIMPENLIARVGCLFKGLQIKPWAIPREKPALPDYPVQSPSTRKRDRILWNKLFAWRLDEYQKLVLLDADMLVLKNIDDIFTIESDLAGVPALSLDEKILFWDPPDPFESEPLDANSWRNFTKPTRFEPGHSGLNGGVMLLRPSIKTFDELIRASQLLKERTCCPTQEFIYRFFELRGQYHRLSPVYNMRKEHKLSVDDRAAWQDIRVYHFVEKKKPWLMGRIESKSFKFANSWWEKADKTDLYMNNLLVNDTETLEVLREARHAAISPQHE